MSLSFDDAFNPDPDDKGESNSLEELGAGMKDVRITRSRSKEKREAEEAGAKEVEDGRRKRKKMGELERAVEEVEIMWREEREADKGEVLIVEGLVGKDEKGIAFAPQNCLFAYNANNIQQGEEVHKVLEERKIEWGGVVGSFVRRFRVKVPHFQGDLPVVVGGLTCGYKTKTAPEEQHTTKQPKKKRRKFKK